MSRQFGPVNGVSVGQIFASRKELSDAKVHCPTQAGISGSQYDGADSIVLSGGYEDDQDHGEVIVYTGHGGRDSEKAFRLLTSTLFAGTKAFGSTGIKAYLLGLSGVTVRMFGILQM